MSAKLALATAALATTTALTVGLAAPAMESLSNKDISIPASAPTMTVDQLQLLASIGIYPVGPGAQILRNLGAGTPQDALNNLAGLAQLIPGDQGTQIKAAIESLSAALEAAQAGFDLPVIGNLAFPEIAVPPMGPAGTIDQIATLEGSLVTQALLILIKTGLLNGDAAGALVNLIGSGTGIDTAALSTLIADLPLNVPGTAGTVTVANPLHLIDPSQPEFITTGAFVSSADKLAIIPTWGLGGTNFALASPTFLNDPTFAKTAILAIALRNTSRPGGGIVALLNPLSQTVGLNLSNADGTGDPQTVVGGGIPGVIEGDITEYDGNVTVWDITAAYDILSDAPSTIYSPLAWLNSGVGAVSPTYLIPANVTDFAAVLEDLTSGEVDIDTLNTLLGTVSSSISMFNVNVGADGNLYVTYDSGHLPLLEPVQVVPRTLSYLPGFDISTPVSSSFENVLTQLVAQGYQDVNMTVDDEGVATFERGFDMADVQAKFWQNPVSWQMGLETPQTVFNSIITGLQENLLDPEGNQFEVFGNSDIGNLVYRNAASVAVAKVVSDALEQVRDTLNPIMNDAQGALTPVAAALDNATTEVNKVIDNGLNEVSKLGVDLSKPALDANRSVNDLTSSVNNGIRDAIGLKPIDSPPAHETPETPEASATATTQRASKSVNTLGAEQSDTPSEAVPASTPAANVSASEDADAKPSKAPRSSLSKRLDKQTEKAAHSLTGAQERASKVTRKLASGDLQGAVNQVGDNIKNRADRLSKDAKNGERKLRNAVKSAGDSVKKATNHISSALSPKKKKTASSGSDGGSGSGE